MNIRLSYNWLNEYLGLTLSPEEFAERISLHGPAVERVERIDRTLDHVRVGEVTKIEPHPNADKLTVAWVKTSVDKEQRTKNKEHVLKIVCGGTNLKEGMKVAVAFPGARVKWHGAGEPVLLEETEIRGVKSSGMICAADELGLAELCPHKEREIIDLSEFDGYLGSPLARAFGLEDAVLEFEVTTNRMDALSVTGLAREAAAALGGSAFKTFDRKYAALDHAVKKMRSASGGKALTVLLADRRACHGYIGALVRGITIGPSPLWLKTRLWASGIRSINNIVDITNYVMLEVGNPMHAFDAEKLSRKEQGTPYQSKHGTGQAKNKGQAIQIVVRMGRNGETLQALDGKEYKLATSTLVIADDERPIAIAGIIGGEATGVTGTTTDVVLEAAAFDAQSVRNTVRELNIRTESSARFEKGLPFILPLYAMARALELTQSVCGGEVQEVVSVWSERPHKKYVSFDVRRVCDKVGIELRSPEVKSMLQRFGFRTAGTVQMRTEVPWWRTSDIEGEHDIVEEVARMYGYHRIPGELPHGAPSTRKDDADILLEDEIKPFFAGAGFTEVISLSMVPHAWTEFDGANGAPAVKLLNPLSEDEAALRRHLTASHLAILGRNAVEFPHAAIFETARVFRGEGMRRGEGLPLQPLILGAAVMGESPKGELFLYLKGVAEALGARIGVAFSFKRGKEESGGLYHPGRNAHLYAGENEIGIVGEVHPMAGARFDIPHRVAVLEIDISSLCMVRTPRTFTPPPLFPPVKRDVAFYIGERVSYDDIAEVMHKAHPLIVEIELFDVYTGDGIPSLKKSMAFHVKYARPDGTLTAPQAEEAHRALCSALKKLGADVR